MAETPQDTFAVSAQPKSGGKSVLILTADDTQDLEFFYPYYRLAEEGCKVDVATPRGGEFKGKMGMGLKNTKSISEVDPMQYDLLYIPGGKAPEALKREGMAVELVKRFVESGKPVAAICHGPQVLAAAGVIKGKRIAAWPDVEKELTQAGATFVNETTVSDGQFITARWPGDLPSHLARTLEALKAGKPSQRNAA